MTADRVQVVVSVPPGTGADLEALWATPLGNGLYRIDNIPFSAYGLHLGDEVLAEAGQAGLRMVEVARRGGHSTYRVLAWPGSALDQIEERLGVIESLGCGVERATLRWVALDVPPTTDRSAVVALLEDGWRDGVWRYEGGDEAPAE